MRVRWSKRQFWSVAAILAALALLPSLFTDEPTTLPTADTENRLPFLLGGTQVHEPDLAHWTRTLKQVGMNAVEVTVYAKQGDWNSDHLWFNREEPAVVEEIRQARSMGLEVVLVLRIAIDHAFPANRFIWHGMIMPDSEEAIASWFRQYTTFVTHWARVAEEEGVAVLGIGSEMNSLNATVPLGRAGYLKDYYRHYWYQSVQRNRALQFADEIRARHLTVRGAENYDNLEAFLDDRFQKHMTWAGEAYFRKESRSLAKFKNRRKQIQQHWLSLIAETRGVFSGKLTYAANFDSYDTVGFWNALDMIGINGYYSLRSDLQIELNADEQRERFESSWDRHLQQLDDFKRRQKLTDMPILFTELGYTFRQHATVEPWAYEGFSIVGWGGKQRRLVVWPEQPIDYDERARALQALLVVGQRRATPLAGILYWKMSTIRQQESIEPFMLHVGPAGTDPLQEILLRFPAAFETPPTWPEECVRLSPNGPDTEFAMSSPTF